MIMIRSRIWSIDWCHFQWPWMSRNTEFKSTPLFDVEYLWNDTR